MSEREALAVRYTQAAIMPFWQKLPFLFLFPFRTGPLVFMLCLVAASGLAGLALGSLGLLLKGTLAYLGLRYGFNVLELFAKGRFEGESPDHRLWGPEKRPAKLGLVITLFILGAVSLGNAVLDSRVASNTAVQARLLASYKASHAEDMESLRQAQDAYDKRAAQPPAPVARPANPADEDAEEAEDDSPASSMARPTGPSREEMLGDAKPVFPNPLWLQLQPVWYGLVLLLASLMLPSAAIVIALEDKFFKALNPLMMLHFIRSIGGAYFALWAFFLLIAGTRQLALTAGESWPPAVRFPVEMALATYLALVLFAMIGYALYQFHQELHLDVDVDFDAHREAGGAEAIARAGSAREALQAAAPADPLERKVQALVKEGRVQAAIDEVKDYMRYDRFDPAWNTRLHSLYQQLGDPVATLAHGQQWLSALARAQQGRPAVEALRALLKLDPAFSVADGDVILPAAQAALHLQDAPLAVKLVKGFDKRFPQHKDTPGIFFLGARLMSEQMRQHEKAVVVLRTVLSRFPDHAVTSEVSTYLSVLEGMLAQQAGQTPAAR